MSNILIIIEHQNGTLNPDSFGLLNAGIQLSRSTGADIHVSIIGQNLDTLSQEVSIKGVHTIHTTPANQPYNHDLYIPIITSLHAELNPIFTLSLHTSTGTDYAPAISSLLDIPLLPDITRFDYTEQIEAVCEMYSSKLCAKISSTSPAILTIRPGSWSNDHSPGDVIINPFVHVIDEKSFNFKVKKHEESPPGEIDISEADLLLSVGRGIGEESNLELIFSTAESIGATVSSSRPIVDRGWLPKDRQVGQSGKKVSPSIYLAVGISGAVQHLAGIKDSQVIISINKDPLAPIFDISHYGVVGDLFEILPALTKEFS